MVVEDQWLNPVINALSLSKFSRTVMRKRYTLFPRQEELRREEAPEIVMIRSVIFLVSINLVKLVINLASGSCCDVNSGTI